MRAATRMAVLLALGAMAPAVPAAQLGDLPGEDVSGTKPVVTESKVQAQPVPARGPGWLAPPVEEQLSRDRTLIPLGKGALFLPTYTEPRREPEISVLNSKGRLVASGLPGERILIDSGTYDVRYGSGTGSQQVPVRVTVVEGHTTVVPPTWGGLIVETLTQDGEYFEGQYELIRMERWINYGKGHGLTEERLQDINTWIVPPGLYRISKAGEGFNSLRNYITVQINPGELSVVELIFADKSTGDVIAGGLRAINARTKVGTNWAFGLRAGGNVNLHQETDETRTSTQTLQFSGDMRLRVNYDNVLYFGSSELFLQENFSKEKGEPFKLTSDEAQFRTNWIRRLTPWLGPYVRGTIESHFFPTYPTEDTVRVARTDGSIDTITPGRDFESAAILDPLEFSEGLGVNVDFISRYYLEATTQVGLAGRQHLVRESYRPTTTAALYEPDASTYEIGLENSLIARARLGNQATLDVRTVIFAPDFDFSELRLDEISVEFRFFISRNVEIDYLFLVREREDTRNRYPRSHNLSLRLSFNY